MSDLQILACDGCGACCMLMMYPPFEDEDESMTIPQELEDEIIAALQAARDGVEGASRIGKPCLWFDPESRKCKNYEYRPAICRRFEVGCDTCIEDRAIHKIGA